MDSPMKIESPTSMSVVFTNQAYEEVENIETVLKSLNMEMEKKIMATEGMMEEGIAKRGNGKGGGGIGIAIMRGNWKKGIVKLRGKRRSIMANWHKKCLFQFEMQYSSWHFCLS
jgi:hypothetical protein